MHDVLLYHVEQMDELGAEIVEAVLKLDSEAMAKLGDRAIDVDLMSRFEGDLFDYYEVKSLYQVGDGVVLPAIVPVNQWPARVGVDKLVMAYTLYETELYTGKRFIENPDWQGDPVEMVVDFYDEPQGWFVLVDYHS